jgi:hypothetical protein
VALCGQEEPVLISVEAVAAELACDNVVVVVVGGGGGGVFVEGVAAEAVIELGSWADGGLVGFQGWLPSGRRVTGAGGESHAETVVEPSEEGADIVGPIFWQVDGAGLSF